jgi:hypothetical protein
MLEGEEVFALVIKREHLRDLMRACPACSPDDADDIADADLDEWSASHEGLDKLSCA